MRRATRIAALCGILFGVASCDTPFVAEAPNRPAPAPEAEVIPEPSAASKALSEYYAGVQTSLLSQGLLRTDGGGFDTPFARRQLVDNFVRIGVFNEFTLRQNQFVEKRSEGRVQRWMKPISISLYFGDTVLPETRTKDLSFVSDYASRLARVTGQQISLTRSKGNFLVAVLNTDELQGFSEDLQELVPGLTKELADQITDMERPVYCAAYTFSHTSKPDAFHTAIAIIRAEHPDLMRRACYHEEIAQALGLSNDSPSARPSIFNDDNEFAYLTRHDELLLKILYDPRLPLGASPDEARPLVEELAAELLGGES